MDNPIIQSDKITAQDFGNLLVKVLSNDSSMDDVSVSEIKLKGNQKFGSNSKSDIFDYVLDGEGRFIIEEKVFEVKKGDLVRIPKNTRYKHEGNLTLLAISSPRFDPNAHTYFD